MKPKELRDFSEELALVYEGGVIKTPIHLSGGNEKQLIKIFNKIKSTDWIVTTYRSHFHWLLSGRDAMNLKEQITDGHSMHIFGERFFTSAIVAGHVPIALGIALALKRKGSKDKVWCFMGDMAARSGIAHECFQYASGHGLPIKFVVENNGKSVNTCTKEVWGKQNKDVVVEYSYKRKYPHAGTGKYVLF